jgi:hypothetical protein
MSVAFEPTRKHGDALADVIDAVLDKGLVINADITVSLAGVELLGIKVRAALASFETAAKYGLEFPSGTNLQAPAWHEIGQAGAGGHQETLAPPFAMEAPACLPAR